VQYASTWRRIIHTATATPKNNRITLVAAAKCSLKVSTPVICGSRLSKNGSILKGSEKKAESTKGGRSVATIAAAQAPAFCMPSGYRRQNVPAQGK
jgi:hypothetical protein